MDLPGLTEITAQVQAWDAPEFWFWSLAALGFSALSFIKAFKGLHRSRLLEDTPTSLVRSASQGYVEFEGTSRRLDGEPVIAPLTGSACTWWSYTVEERKTYRVNKTRHTHWQTINSGSSEALFELEDSSGRCIVDPEGAEVFPSATQSWRGSSAWPEKHGRGIFGRYRYTERRMHVGDPLARRRLPDHPPGRGNQQFRRRSARGAGCWPTGNPAKACWSGFTTRTTMVSWI